MENHNSGELVDIVPVTDITKFEEGETMDTQFSTVEHMALFTSSFVSKLAAQVEVDSYALDSCLAETRGAIDPRNLGASAV